MTINTIVARLNPAPTFHVHGSYQTRTFVSPGGTANPRKALLTRMGSRRLPLRSTFQPGQQGMLLATSV